MSIFGKRSPGKPGTISLRKGDLVWRCRQSTRGPEIVTGYRVTGEEDFVEVVETGGDINTGDRLYEMGGDRQRPTWFRSALP